MGPHHPAASAERKRNPKTQHHPPNSQKPHHSPIHKHNPIPLPAAVLLLELKVEHRVPGLVRGEAREELLVERVVVLGGVRGDLLLDDDGLVVRGEREDDVFVRVGELHLVEGLDACFVCLDAGGLQVCLVGWLVGQEMEISDAYREVECWMM